MYAAAHRIFEEHKILNCCVLQRFQKNVAKAAASKMGREFVINFIGTVAKLAQAMNTPEMKSTTDQAIETAHSFIDLLASREVKFA